MIFLTLSLQISSCRLLDLLGVRNRKQTQPKPLLLANPSLSPPFLLSFSQKTSFLIKWAPKDHFWSFKIPLKCKAMFGLLPYSPFSFSLFCFSLQFCISIRPCLAFNPFNPIFHFWPSNSLFHFSYHLSFISH